MMTRRIKVIQWSNLQRSSWYGLSIVRFYIKAGKSFYVTSCAASLTSRFQTSPDPTHKFWLQGESLSERVEVRNQWKIELSSSRGETL